MHRLRFRAGRRFAAGVAAWVFVSLLAISSSLHAAGEWQVANSFLRYKLILERRPTHPSAGYYVHLPDGGILRGGASATVVMTESGKVLASYLLWQNSESGFSIVFADPGAEGGAVYVYMQAARQPQLWKPETGLTPSALLCTLPGRDSITAAESLAQLGPVDATVHVTNKAGIPKAPFSIGGDLSGRPRPGSFYLLSYVEARDDGSYWFSPFVREGQSEILIDGTRLNPHEHSKKWGGNGAAVTLTKGLHRVEAFQTAGGLGPYSSDNRTGGLMYLTWRPPKEQLKGVESRVLSDSEIARSGECEVEGVEAKDGSPVAAATAKASLCYWFDNEEPLIVYVLSALTAGQPAGCTYAWSFPEGSAVSGPKTAWIFPGLRDYKIRLTVRSASGSSSCIVPFFTFSTESTNLDSPYDRANFRKVLTIMLKAYPHAPDPVADWSNAWWNDLMRTMEAQGSYPLLHQLFTEHFDPVRRKLSPEQLSSLEDILLNLMQRQDPQEALAWIRKFYDAAPSIARRSELKLREGEVQMYYLGDRARAKQIFTTLTTLPGEPGELAKIRLGDLALLGGDLNAATAIYADVQNRARTRRNAAPATDGLATDKLMNGSIAKTGPFAGWNSAALPMQDTAQTAPGADLRHGALQEVSLSENVRTLIEGDFLLEALQALHTWELEFPLSKVSGDYINRESDLYIRNGRL